MEPQKKSYRPVTVSLSVGVGWGRGGRGVLAIQLPTTMELQRKSYRPVTVSLSVGVGWGREGGASNPVAHYDGSYRPVTVSLSVGVGRGVGRGGASNPVTHYMEPQRKSYRPVTVSLSVGVRRVGGLAIQLPTTMELQRKSYRPVTVSLSVGVGWGRGGGGGASNPVAHYDGTAEEILQACDSKSFCGGGREGGGLAIQLPTTMEPQRKSYRPVTVSLSVGEGWGRGGGASNPVAHYDGTAEEILQACDSKSFCGGGVGEGRGG